MTENIHPYICVFTFASRRRQVQCTRAVILMRLMDEACRAEFNGQASNAE